MHNRIRLDTLSEVESFLAITKGIDSDIELYNNKNGYRVSAKSYLGVLLASQEWGDNIYVHSNEDIYDKIKKFIIETSPNDGVAIHEQESSMNLKNIVKNKISVEFCYFKKEGDKLKAIREDIAKVSSVTFFKSLDDSNENSVKIECELVDKKPEQFRENVCYIRKDGKMAWMFCIRENDENN